MSATECLRERLDRRGVKWTPDPQDLDKETFFMTSGGFGVVASEHDGELMLMTEGLTPSEAIEATLGRKFKWHLMDEEVPPTGYGHYIIMGRRGALYYADRFEVDTHIDSGGYFHVPNNRCGYKYAREVKAWAEIPMLGVES